MHAALAAIPTQTGDESPLFVFPDLGGEANGDRRRVGSAYNCLRSGRRGIPARAGSRDAPGGKGRAALRSVALRCRVAKGVEAIPAAGTRCVTASVTDFAARTVAISPRVRARLRPIVESGRTYLIVAL